MVNLYCKTCVKQPLKNRQNKDLKDKINRSLMKVESIPAILLTYIKQLSVLKTNFRSSFWVAA